MAKITPALWYAEEAEEAARFHVSLFDDSRIDRVTALPADPFDKLRVRSTSKLLMLSLSKHEAARRRCLERL